MPFSRLPLERSWLAAEPSMKSIRESLEKDRKTNESICLSSFSLLFVHWRWRLFLQTEQDVQVWTQKQSSPFPFFFRNVPGVPANAFQGRDEGGMIPESRMLLWLPEGCESRFLRPAEGGTRDSPARLTLGFIPISRLKKRGFRLQNCAYSKPGFNTRRATQGEKRI